LLYSNIFIFSSSGVVGAAIQRGVALLASRLHSKSFV
jgi:hypothetical protein